MIYKTQVLVPIAIVSRRPEDPGNAHQVNRLAPNPGLAALVAATCLTLSLCLRAVFLVASIEALNRQKKTRMPVTFSLTPL